MLNHYILSYIGEDRPGLVDELSTIIANHQGSWLESRMANLAGKFTGIVRLSIDSANAESLEADLKAIKREDLILTFTRAEPHAKGQHQRLAIRVTANDRPGIVRELAAQLMRLNVNVEDLQTNVTPGAWSGEPVFEALVKVSAAETLDLEHLRQELEHLSDDLMVELVEKT